MNFKEFLSAYREDALHKDAAWRAYDIFGLIAANPVRAHHIFVKHALKRLGMSYAGELAVPEFMARYGVAVRAEAETLLAAYQIWSLADAGRPVRGLMKRSGLPT